MPHERLIYKFQKLGNRGNLLQWIKTFGRKQRVTLRNGASSWRDVITSVPQGRIIGPMIFLLFVNDMPDVVISTAKCLLMIPNYIHVEIFIVPKTVKIFKKNSMPCLLGLTTRGGSTPMHRNVLQ